MEVNNNQEPVTYAGMVNNYLNEKSDLFTYNVAIPLMKLSYGAVGRVASCSLGMLSAKLGKRVSKAWYDPLSSGAVLKICKPVEWIAHLNASRKPTSNRIFHFLDRSLIGLSQQLFIYMKEVNHLLSLPQDLKTYFATLSFDRFLNKPSLVLGKNWVWISGPVILAKQVLLCLINKVFEVIDAILSPLTFNYSFKLFGYLKEIAKVASMKTHLTFAHIAYRVIEHKEKEIRKKIVQSVGNYAVEYFTTRINQIALKTILGLTAYALLKPSLQSTTGIPSGVIDVVGVAILSHSLWKNVFAPTLEPYYHTYSDEFDPKSSNLQAFCNTHSIHYLYPPLRALQVYLEDDGVPTPLI